MKNQDFMNSLDAFLRQRGVALEEYGSAEFAVSKADALLFLDMLDASGVMPLGLEVWKPSGDRLDIDALSGWYAEGKNQYENAESARAFLLSELVSETDMLTIQFR
jgi:hypothetical protein